MTDKEKKDIRHYAKQWDIDTICGQLTSKGMEFMAEKCTDVDLKEYRAICIKELIKRINK